MSFNYTKLNEGSWFYLFKLEDNFIDYLWKQIEQAREENISVKYNASGVISKILKLKDPEDIVLDHVFIPFYDMDLEDSMLKRMGSAFNQVFADNDFRIKPALESLQVNIQKKYEFNPLHKHRGLFSFVIWLKIPYNHEDEAKTVIGESNVANAIGNFHFVYSTDCGLTSYPINMNSDIEGYCVLFPSYLPHQVYPFYTSDEERITVAGNIYFKIEQ